MIGGITDRNVPRRYARGSKGRYEKAVHGSNASPPLTAVGFDHFKKNKKKY